MGPTVIDKNQPIESIGSKLRGHARTFDRSRTVQLSWSPTSGKVLGDEQNQAIPLRRELNIIDKPVIPSPIKTHDALWLRAVSQSLDYIFGVLVNASCESLA